MEEQKQVYTTAQIHAYFMNISMYTVISLLNKFCKQKTYKNFLPGNFTKDRDTLIEQSIFATQIFQHENILHEIFHGTYTHTYVDTHTYIHTYAYNTTESMNVEYKYHKLWLLGACTYKFRRSFLEIYLVY